jgi:hypothetical protein
MIFRNFDAKNDLLLIIWDRMDDHKQLPSLGKN